MFSSSTFSDIPHVIQLAVAPVFLLTAVGTLLAVLTNRLGRSVDRRRVLASHLLDPEAQVAARAREELLDVEQRIRLIYAAIALAVLCAIFVCLLIALAFVDALIALDLARWVAAIFVLAMLALTGSLGVFLREIFLAVSGARSPIR
ncbi:MAG: hypothetical protein A3H35_12035 [Betaproteobacteria bacterium RIFCSPLOWO2_02_FULL_62_17]|nr:MAG: hypothetical protein A3H35_12035 [Betaproteobacteria bacterium RIFCSPLOWO2_02_FULL_62_17]